MDKKDLALIAAGVTIAVLVVDRRNRRRKTDRLIHASRALQSWATISQRIMMETWVAHPEVMNDLPESLKIDIDFYAIMTKEDLT